MKNLHKRWAPNTVITICITFMLQVSFLHFYCLPHNPNKDIILSFWCPFVLDFCVFCFWCLCRWMGASLSDGQDQDYTISLGCTQTAAVHWLLAHCQGSAIIWCTRTCKFILVVVGNDSLGMVQEWWWRWGVYDSCTGPDKVRVCLCVHVHFSKKQVGDYKHWNCEFMKERDLWNSKWNSYF